MEPYCGNSNCFTEGLRRFAETTSIKCLPRIVKSKPVWQKALWTCALLAGASFTVYTLRSLTVDYLKYETTASFTHTFETAPFPDLTVCNLNPFWANDYFEEELNVSMTDFLLMIDKAWSDSISANNNLSSYSMD